MWKEARRQCRPYSSSSSNNRPSLQQQHQQHPGTKPTHAHLGINLMMPNPICVHQATLPLPAHLHLSHCRKVRVTCARQPQVSCLPSRLPSQAAFPRKLIHAHLDIYPMMRNPICAHQATLPLPAHISHCRKVRVTCARQPQAFCLRIRLPSQAAA
jgi:hypothetical protein